MPQLLCWERARVIRCVHESVCTQLNWSAFISTSFHSADKCLSNSATDKAEFNGHLWYFLHATRASEEWNPAEKYSRKWSLQPDSSKLRVTIRRHAQCETAFTLTERLYSIFLKRNISNGKRIASFLFTFKCITDHQTDLIDLLLFLLKPNTYLSSAGNQVILRQSLALEVIIANIFHTYINCILSVLVFHFLNGNWFYTQTVSPCVGENYCICEDSWKKPFVAPEEAAWNLTNVLKRCHSSQRQLGLKTTKSGH